MLNTEYIRSLNANYERLLLERKPEEKKYDYATGIIYSDIFFECEKIGDYAINVTEAIKEIGTDN